MKLYKILIPLDKFYMSFYLPKKINKEIIPKKDSIILAGNHTSNLDALLLMSCTNRGIRFLAKKELCKGKIKTWFFKSVGIIPVDRSKKNPEVIKEACYYLNNKEAIGIFPEGTINKTKDIIMPFKYGAVKMAKETNSMIIPFAISGKYRLFRKSVKIIFGTPYRVTGSIEEENTKLENKEIKLLKEIK